jgi:hypothetical protein
MGDASRLATLSSRGVARLASLEHQNFRFIVGQTIYPCSQSEAAFLSDHVCALLHTDPSATEYAIDGISGNPDAFELVMQILRGELVNLTEENAKSVLTLSDSLGNRELSDIALNCILSNQKLDCSTVVSRLQRKRGRDLAITVEVDYIARHLSSVADLDSLEVHELEAILTSPALLLETEDWLLNLILGKDLFRVLLRYVQCKFLTSAGIEKFIDSVAIDSIDSKLWSSICDRLRGVESCRTARFLQLFPYAQRDFDGIIASLNGFCQGNACTNGLVEITSSSQQVGQHYQLVDYSWEGSWYTESKLESWVRVHFVNRKAWITSYSIKSFAGNSFPKNWVIEVSENENTWREIDRREGTDVLCKRYIVAHFQCQQPYGELCRYVRLRNIGLTNSQNDHLCLCNIEFFGGLRTLK